MGDAIREIGANIVANVGQEVIHGSRSANPLTRLLQIKNIYSYEPPGETRSCMFLNNKYLFFFVACILYSTWMPADILINLSKTEEKVLSEFFHAMLWGSQAGYVLYGNKPICMEGYGSGDSDKVFKIGHHFRSSVNAGVKLWKKLQLPFESSKFAIVLQENFTDSFILFINKEAFKKTFNKHASLFRYTLGADLTADKLLKEFKSGKKDFLSTLNHDKVLIGILLGFGLENSLYVGRFEQISKELDCEKKKSCPNCIFSIKPKKDENFILPFIYSKLQPRLSYDSLEQEQKMLNDKINISSIALARYVPQLIFGRVISNEDELIKNYEDTQLKLIDVLNYPQWLTDVLSHFYGQPVKFQMIEDPANEDAFPKESSQIIAQTIFSAFVHAIDKKSAQNLHELIEGMKEAEKRKDAHYIAPFPYGMMNLFPSKSEAFFLGFKAWSYYKFNKKMTSLQAVISQLEHLQEKNTLSLTQPFRLLHQIYWQIFDTINQHEKSIAASNFETLQARKDIQCLVKDHLYYQQIKPGNGDQISKDSLIQVSYILKTIYGNLIENQSKESSIDLRRAIKGFRESFPFMKEGEQGILFIHPDWGIKDYFSPPYFSPYLIAEFQIHKIRLM